MIEKNKTEFQERKKPPANKKNMTRAKSICNDSDKLYDNIEENLITSFNDEPTAVVSRRSSLKSSTFDVTRNESFESDNAVIPPR